MDLEWYKRKKPDADDQSMIEEELDTLKETIQLYYPDLSTDEIQGAEGIMFQTKWWLDHPIYEKDLTLTQKVTQFNTTYEENKKNGLITHNKKSFYIYVGGINVWLTSHLSIIKSMRIVFSKIWLSIIPTTNADVSDDSIRDWYVVSCDEICYITDIFIEGTITADAGTPDSADNIYMDYMYTIPAAYASTEAGVWAAYDTDHNYFYYTFEGGEYILDGDDEQSTQGISINSVDRNGGFNSNYMLSSGEKLIIEIETYENGDDTIDFQHTITISYTGVSSDEISITELNDVTNDL